MPNTSHRLHPDRLLPVEPTVRAIARRLFAEVEHMPILSPHGHCEAAWFVDNQPFPNPAALLVQPDHYVLRLLLSAGVTLDQLGVASMTSPEQPADPRSAWRTFASHYHLFRGTPSRIWLDHALYGVLEVERALDGGSADAIFDDVSQKLQSPAFSPRSLLQKFDIRLLATTDAATDTLDAHKAWDQNASTRIIPTFRPDAVINPAHQAFSASLDRLAELTGENVYRVEGYRRALQARRDTFKQCGATATDHGVEHVYTQPLDPAHVQPLLDKALKGGLSPDEAIRFEGHMLFEMARMSVDDGLVMQLHAGSRRNYDPRIFAQYGPDKGFDIPGPTDWLTGLKPMLNAFGFERNFQLILYTLDETTYGRELAPLAGVYPSVFLGAPWWFFDSPEGMRRYRRTVTETAGYGNTAGFVDDTRGFLSIPARHDMFRRIEAGNLAQLVAEHALGEHEAVEVLTALTDSQVRHAYRLDGV